MEREKQIKQVIRDNWFKDHIATLTECGELKILDWRKSDDWAYAIRYVFDGNKMYISGDIGQAVFCLTWKADVHSFNKIGTDYFMEKMSAFSRDRYDFDGKEAAAYLKEWLDEHIEDMGFDNFDEEKEEFLEKFNELMEDAESCDTESRWGHEYVNGKHLEFISELDRDYWEWIYHIGRVVPHWILGYIVGLQMASEQLKSTEV